MRRIFIKSLAIAILSLSLISSSFAQEDFTKYVDPTIHLPNQMIRMFPIKKDYISDQVTAFPLQVVSHRDAGILQMKISLGEITEQISTFKKHL